MSRKKWQARPLMLRRDVRFRAVVAGVSVLDRDLDMLSEDWVLVDPNE